MAFVTNALGLFYKRIGPTGSIPPDGDPDPYTGYLPEFWFTASGTNVTGALLNLPTDTLLTTYLTTRNSASNATYMALPWGSPANDFLWNTTTPSWSYQDSSSIQSKFGTGGTATVIDRLWSLSMYESKSFFRQFQIPTPSSTLGVDSYPVTSSWHIYDEKFLSGSNFANFRYVHQENNTKQYPTYIGSRYSFVATESVSQVAYPITFPAILSTSTGSLDGQYFDRSNGAGITRAAISRSLMTASIYANDNTATGLRYKTEALKARRLFFPIPVSGSGTTGGTDYWFKQATGQAAKDLFMDNGGIYNIQFTLKRYLPRDLYPDTSSFMSVFIFDVIPQIPSSSACIDGAPGWYPPQQNIVTIGNGYKTTPIMTFIDAATGYQVEKFDINVVQYGNPAQLCFEVSGSLADDKYFGIIINDVQFCKIGVTTDPRFIKPQTGYESVIDYALTYGSGLINPSSGAPSPYNPNQND